MRIQPEGAAFEDGGENLVTQRLVVVTLSINSSSAASSNFTTPDKNPFKIDRISQKAPHALAA
jgi:hypothetical protein